MAREVDRLLAGLSSFGAQATSDHRSPSGSVRTGRPGALAGRGDRIALWGRVALGVVLGGMMTQWPYHHGCGLPLAEYLAAVTMVMIAGTWIAVASWRLRHPPSHMLALLLVLWGMALAAAQVLPRVGYAAEQLPWRC